MKVLGVDLGSYSIKVAELDVTSKGYALTGYFDYPLSMDPNKDRNLEMIEILRGLSSKYDPLNTKWVVAVPQQMVSTHFKTFPFRERPKILKSLAFELEDDIPLDIDETIFDAKILEFVGPMADILTVASPKEAVEEALDAAKDGGFEPEIVSVEGLALGNLFESWALPPPERAIEAPAGDDVTQIALANTPKRAKLVLHLGHSRSNLLIYRENARDNSLIAVRSISWGGLEIAENLAKAFKIPLYEAVKTLQTKSFILMNSAGATRDQLLLSKTVSTSVDTLMRDLRLTLLEVRSSFNVNFVQIEMIGGTSQIQNLGAYITQALEIPANVAHPLEKLQQVRIETNTHIEAVSSVAIGLALEGLKRPRNPAINLRKGDFARENEGLKEFWSKWHVPIQAACALFAIFCLYSFVRDTIAAGLSTSMEEHVAEVAKTEAGLKGSAASESGLRNFISARKKLVADQDALIQAEKYVSALDILAKLSERLPVEKTPRPGIGLDVTRLKIDNDDLTIEGRVQGAAGIAQIEKALKEIGKGETLKKAATTTVLPGAGTLFAYTMKVNRKP